MARRAPAAFALALVLVACAPAAPPATPLNSERIEQVLGSYGIDVLYSEPQLRLSSLYSTHAGTEITWTLAIVGYPDVVDPRLAEPDALIQDGAFSAPSPRLPRSRRGNVAVHHSLACCHYRKQEMVWARFAIHSPPITT
jgi:hypothetical protein